MSLKSSLLRELAKGDRTGKQLRGALGAERKKIDKSLQDLVKEGKIKVNKGVYALRGPHVEPLPARIVKLGRAFAFASALDGSGDIFIPGHSLQGAMPGDEVLVSLAPYPAMEKNREGEVDEILTRQDTVVGTVEKVEKVGKEDGNLVLIPDNAPDTPLLISKSADGGAKEGEKAAGVILERGSRHEEHKVGITIRFGSADSARQCAKAILYAAGVEKSFPSKVKSEAKELGTGKIPKDVIKARQDLRDACIFTIDSSSTKDMDDAISAKKTEDGYELGVHIADVSYYVRPQSALDEEAMNRGTSIYYADSVIPMLPRQLSNGVCSLNPGEDRLAFSCFMTLDSEGRMLDYRFVKSVINSRVKGIYSEINAILEDTAEEEILDKYTKIASDLPIAEEIYHKLSILRQARGSMEIESSESKLLVDEEGRCVGVERQNRGEAERMIEEFMLAANTAAAHLARRLDIPFLYRVHDRPSAEKIQNLQSLLTAVGLDAHFASTIPTQRELSDLLDQTRDTTLRRPVHNGVLRSMAKAKYDTEPKGHYGLALGDYAHFTSPIRRYPDLLVHRILSDATDNVPEGQIRKKYKAVAEMAAVLSSERELRAAQVERDCEDCYKAEYMKQFIGREFEGVISSVVSFGLYVELPNTVEGLVHISAISKGEMHYVEGVSLTDALTGTVYRLGELLQVKVAGVNISQGKIDFTL